MAHLLVLGPSTCGKTTWLIEFLKQQKVRHKKRIVALVKHQPERYEGVADFITGDKAKFFEVISRPKSVGLICVVEDVHGIQDGKGDKLLLETAAEGRHYGGGGHAFVYVTQSAFMIHKDIRRNCGFLTTFKQAEQDCDELARLFMQPALKQGHLLERYEYLTCAKGFGPVTRGKTKK